MATRLSSLNLWADMMASHTWPSSISTSDSELVGCPEPAVVVLVMIFLRIDLARAFRSAREVVLAVIMKSPGRPGVVPTLLVHLLLRIRRWQERDRGRPGSFSAALQ